MQCCCYAYRFTQYVHTLSRPPCMQALGPGFSVYLQYVVPLALQSCGLDDGTFADGDENEDDEGRREDGDGAAGPLGGLDSDDEEGGGGGGRSFNVRTGVWYVVWCGKWGCVPLLRCTRVAWCKLGSHLLITTRTTSVCD